jgi:hypothetical protein
VQSLRWVDEAIKIMGGSEGLTALQELILDGDINTAMYQIRRLVDLGEEDDSEEEGDKTSEPESAAFSSIPLPQKERSILHYAALTSQLEMCRRLLKESPFGRTINEGDLVTGFTPLHIASFVQNPSLVYLFLSCGSQWDLSDNYGATVADYLRLQGRIPYKIFSPPSFTILPSSIPDGPAPTLKTLNLAEFESEMDVWASSKLSKVPTDVGSASSPSPNSSKTIEWAPNYSITDDYVEELMFGGYEAPDQKDMEFRRKYFPLLERNAGEDGLVVAFINTQVGWGCYAAKPFAKGDFIVGYTGAFVSKKLQKFRDYAMACSLDAIVLDASHRRNLGAFINHSSQPNAEAQAVFDRGIDRIVITAAKAIPIGQQICIDYGTAYFKTKAKAKTDKKDDKGPLANYQDMLANVASKQMPSTLPAEIIEELTTRHTCTSKK